MAKRIIEIKSLEDGEVKFGSINWTGFMNKECSAFGIFYKGDLIRAIQGVKIGDRLFIETNYPYCKLEKVRLPKDPRKALLWEKGFRNYMYKDNTQDIWEICANGASIISDGDIFKMYADAKVSSCWTSNDKPIAIYLASSATIEDVEKHVKEIEFRCGV